MMLEFAPEPGAMQCLLVLGFTVVFLLFVKWRESVKRRKGK